MSAHRPLAAAALLVTLALAVGGASTLLGAVSAGSLAALAFVAAAVAVVSAAAIRAQRRRTTPYW